MSLKATSPVWAEKSPLNVETIELSKWAKSLGLARRPDSLQKAHSQNSFVPIFMRIYLGNEDDLWKNYKFVKEMAFGCVFCVSFQATPFFGAK